jgi:hypothetical protein
VADRDPVVVARWAGGERAEVVFPSGEAPVLKGGADEPSAMKMVLASLAALMSTSSRTEPRCSGSRSRVSPWRRLAASTFAATFGIDADSGSGYERVAYAVRLKTRGGTPDQLAELRRACEHASPVGDTLQRNVALSLQFDGS